MDTMAMTKLLVMLCLACNSVISQENTSQNLPELLPESGIDKNNQNSFPSFEKELELIFSSSAYAVRKTINPRHVAKNCESWINPAKASGLPSGITNIPAVISFSKVTLNDTFSLEIVNKYADIKICLLGVAKHTEFHVSVYHGRCNSSDPVAEAVWPHLLESKNNDWPFIAKPQFLLPDYFHLEIAQEYLEENKTSSVVRFRPNGKREKELSISIDDEVEYVQLFATKIETAVNLVFFHNNNTGSVCKTLGEPVEWNQDVYFHPHQETTDVKIYISYCNTTKILQYSVSPEIPHWHKLSFIEISLDGNENSHRNILIDDEVISNITLRNDDAILNKLEKECPLDVVVISMDNAIWYNKCNSLDIIRGGKVVHFENFPGLAPNKSSDDLINISLIAENSNICKHFKFPNITTSRPTINQDFAAKACTNWINSNEDSDKPSAFASIPAVISMSGVSRNDTFRLSIVNRYGKPLACFVAHGKDLEANVFAYNGECYNGDLIQNDTWSHMVNPNHDKWPCLVKPHFHLSSYFHIEITTIEKIQANSTTEIVFRPNGESKRSLSVKTNSSAKYVYIYASRIKTAVNMVYFKNGYTASKCQTLDEPIAWTQDAYFLPQEGTTNIKIYLSYCHFTEVLELDTTSISSDWHKLSFSEDASQRLDANIFFYRNILVDDAIVGNITTTFDQPPILLRLMRVCPLAFVKVSMINAIWTHRCNPENLE